MFVGIGVSAASPRCYILDFDIDGLDLENSFEEKSSCSEMSFLITLFACHSVAK